MREQAYAQRGCVVWFTGLSGSGKSTVAHRVDQLLCEQSRRSFVLDGDNLRHGLCADLGFDQKSREENIRRTGEVAKLFAEAGVIVLAALVSPFRRDRDSVRALVPQGTFIEVHVAASLAVCEARDPKGLYQKARRGEIAEFTGISSPYEPPLAPELTLDTGAVALEECAKQVLQQLVTRRIFAMKESV